MRWVLVIVGVIAVVRFAAGWLGHARQEWTPLDARLLSIFPITVDIQLRRDPLLPGDPLAIRGCRGRPSLAAFGIA
jgi:hypothetical protein